MRPCFLSLDARALKHNLQLARRYARDRKVWAVVKADAYGHGLVWAARQMKTEVDGFAVASLEEAIRLRQADIRAPILLLEGLFEADEAALAQSLETELVIYRPEQVAWLKRHDADFPWKLWLKVDTGMHRLGIPVEAVAEWVETLRRQLPRAHLALMTHFASADGTTTAAIDFTRQQYRDFRLALAQFIQVCRKQPVAISLSNSAALVHHRFSEESWVRPGIMLYGATPQAPEARPVMRFHSRLIHMQWIARGQGVGYDRTWVAPRETLVGTIAAGYGDGYPRQVPSGTPVWVAGARVPLIGRVSMDMITVDLTAHPRREQLHPGAPVELWGQHVPVTEIARAADTIAYTLCCGITPRVRRCMEDAHSLTEGAEHEPEQ